jgi:hypothetical protein
MKTIVTLLLVLGVNSPSFAGASPTVMPDAPPACGRGEEVIEALGNCAICQPVGSSSYFIEVHQSRVYGPASTRPYEAFDRYLESGCYL